MSRSGRSPRRAPVRPAALRRAVAAVALSLAAGAAAPACREGEVAPRRPLTTEAGPEERIPDQVIQSGTHVVTREGVKKALLQARRIAFFNAEAKVEADTMDVTFFDATGAATSRLRALSGEIDQRTNDMIARGDVIVTAEDGTRIQGEELRYDATRDRILSNQPVVILQDGNRIRSQGVEADPALTNIRMTGSSAVLRNELRVGGRRAPPPPAAAGASAGAPASPPGPAAAPAAAPAPGPAPPQAAPAAPAPGDTIPAPVPPAAPPQTDGGPAGAPPPAGPPPAPVPPSGAEGA